MFVQFRVHFQPDLTDNCVFARMNSFAGRMALLVMALVMIGPLIGVAATDLQITMDPSRPLTLYRAPSTFRRDARGQLHPSIIIRAERPGQRDIQTPAVDQAAPSTAQETHRDARAQQVSNHQQVFKPILVTSRPFGFGSLNNEIHKHQSPTTTTSTTTTTTTENPLFDGKGQPTIPFFSISCTFGTSCSQIIAARQHKTPVPTFKPYTKEEIEKGKGSLLAMFPPNSRTTTTTTFKPRSTTRYTTPRPSTTTTTTTTTQRPATSFRVRTTTAPTKRPYPVYIRSTTTTAPPATKSTTKYPDLWSQWKWPSYIPSATTEKSIDRFYVQYTTQKPVTTTKASGLSTWTLAEITPTTTPSTTTVKSTTTTTKSNTAYQGHWLSLLSATLNGLQKNQKKPAVPASLSKPSVLRPAAPSPVKQATTSSAILRPVVPSSTKQSAVQTAIYKPAAASPAQPVAPSVAPLSHDVAASSAEWSDENQNSLVWKPEAADQQGIITIRQPAVVSTHEIISTKGNKISLITGAKRPATAPPSYAAYPLPPEVSISSQLIGLKVKPKSLQEPAHIENVQGVQIETDGQDVNLSHLIMRQNIARPARYLTALNTPTGRGFQTPNARHFDDSQWQPLRY